MSLWTVRWVYVQLETDQLEDTDQNNTHCTAESVCESPYWLKKHLQTHTSSLQNSVNTTPFSQKDKSKNKNKNKKRKGTNERVTIMKTKAIMWETSESVWQLKLFKGNCWTFILDADIKDWENTEGGKKQNLPDVLIQLWCFLFPCNTRTNLLHCK